jgi:hypothetical protein
MMAGVLSASVDIQRSSLSSTTADRDPSLVVVLNRPVLRLAGESSSAEQ